MLTTRASFWPKPPASVRTLICGPGLAGGIALGQHVAGPIGALPVRHRRRTGPPGHELRPLDQLVAMDVARAVGKDLPNRYPDDELRVWVGLDEVVVLGHGGDAVDAHAVALFEIDEQHPHLARGESVAHREIHAVAVVVGKRQRAVVHHATVDPEGRPNCSYKGGDPGFVRVVMNATLSSSR